MIEPIPIPFAPETDPQLTNTLEPHINADTVSAHFNKHYKGYVKNLNKLIQGTVHEDSSLEDIVTSSAGPIFNNAAQAYNHEFYFNCLTPKSSLSLNEGLEKEMVKSWGADPIEKFKKAFNDQAKKLFGSGWVWLVWNVNEEQLQIMSTPNAVTPISPEDGYSSKYIPLMCYDLWEHNYYVQYLNDRGAALEAFWEVVNWKFINKQFDKISND